MDRHHSEASARAIINRIRFLLPDAMLRDQSYVRRTLSRLQKSGRRTEENAVLSELGRLEKRLSTSVEKRKVRDKRIPRVSFPEELPISKRSQTIIKAIQDNPVVIISGETGCG
ncbi:MAG: hypothetical protein OEY18_08870, partial [Candidatus Aminicenantes bacterium]|nr:hypothetical protein [Candidatus Aminicenantes bacterium]